MRPFGKNPSTGLEVFAVHAKSLREADAKLSLPTRSFSALIACDSDPLTVEEIGEFAIALMERGAVYICCWGKGCERFHDIIDEIWATREMNGKYGAVAKDSTLMTTWHNDQSLDEALWFSLFSAWPLDDELESCSTIAITIGNEAWASSIVNHLENMEQFENEIPDTN